MGEQVEHVRRSLRALVEDLRRLVDRDPEQEVLDMAVPVLDAAIRQARDVLAEHPVAEAVADVVSPERVADWQQVRAADALLVANQLLAALPPPPPPRAMII